MVNLLKNQFPGTLQVILYKIKLTDIWGKINLHIYKWLKIFKFLFVQIFPVQMCVQRKNPEVSSMFLKGDI